MSRAYGSSATLLLKRETVYGSPASGNYTRMPFNSCALGSEQGLIDERTADPQQVALDLMHRTYGEIVADAFDLWWALAVSAGIMALGAPLVHWLPKPSDGPNGRG